MLYHDPIIFKCAHGYIDERGENGNEGGMDVRFMQKEKVDITGPLVCRRLCFVL